MVEIVQPNLQIFTGSEIDLEAGKVVKYVGDVTAEARGWRRTIRSIGGYLDGSFRMIGDLRDLQQVFYYWLGYNLREISNGSQTWEGLLYEFDLTYHGVMRRRSLDLLRNYVTVLYHDDEGETQVTTPVSNADSIQRYGRYEGVWTLDQYSATAADAFANGRLKKFGWPQIKALGASPYNPEAEGADQAVLDVTVRGSIQTANWRYQQVGDGTQDNISDWISEILTTDCEFLEPGIINTNALQVYKATSQPRRCWDLLQELTEVGDGSYNPYRIYCSNDGLVHYEQISATPKYYWRKGRLMGPFNDDHLANPWTVAPAVVRDMDYPIRGYQEGGWLTDLRDFYVDEIEVDSTRGLYLRSEYFDEGEILISQLNYLASMVIPEEEE